MPSPQSWSGFLGSRYILHQLSGGQRRISAAAVDQLIKRSAAAPPSPPPFVHASLTGTSILRAHLGQCCEPLLSGADLFEERHDAARTVERRLEAIHLYGVDLMSTRDCLAYFKAYQPTKVEWLDDSSCEDVKSPTPLWDMWCTACWSAPG